MPLRSIDSLIHGRRLNPVKQFLSRLADLLWRRPIPVMLELHSQDDFNGRSIQVSLEFVPRADDILRLDDDVSPEAYERFSAMSSAEMKHTLFLQVLYVEQHIHEERAREIETLPVVHVQVQPTVFRYRVPNAD